MTRKRFVKLLMSTGMSRNDANATAHLYRVEGTTYAEAAARELPILALGNVAEKLAEAFRQVTAVVDQVAENMAEVFRQVAVTASRAAEEAAKSFRDLRIQALYGDIAEEVKPLRAAPADRLDGLTAQFYAIDEIHRAGPEYLRNTGQRPETEAQE